MERPVDPKRVVADGYDAIATAYAEWGLRDGDPIKRRFCDLVVDRLPGGAAVLDVGCGTGEHVTARLADSFEVTGLDISPRSIELARTRVPGPRYLVGDVAAVDLAAVSFDAVTAFFSLIHVPRDEHPNVMRRIAGWLKPGGLLVATMGAADEEHWQQDWLGAPMYWSHFDAETNRQVVADAGFEIESSDVISELEDGVAFNHQWIVATKRVVAVEGASGAA